MFNAFLEGAVFVIVVLLARWLSLKVADSVVGAVPVYEASKTVAHTLLVDTFFDEAALLNLADDSVCFVVDNVFGAHYSNAVLHPSLHLHLCFVDHYPWNSCLLAELLHLIRFQGLQLLMCLGRISVTDLSDFGVEHLLDFIKHRVLWLKVRLHYLLRINYNNFS